MLAAFKRVFVFVVAWFKAKPKAKAEPAAPPIDPPPAIVSPPIAPAVAPIQKPNRALRRKYERARRKHDKFVAPKGELPPAPERPKAERKPPEPKPPTIEVADNELLIVDSHHEGGDAVLYEETELYGEFNFRDTILEQLERYFVYLERMKRGDPEAFAFYKQVGVTLLPYSATGLDRRSRDKHSVTPDDVRQLPPHFNQHRPGFGCFAYGIDRLTERNEITERLPQKGYSLWVPKFLYFTKNKQPPPTVQHITGGDIYTLTVYWDRPNDPKFERKRGAAQQYPIFISADGKTVQVLRTIDTRYFKVPAKRWEREKKNKYCPQPRPSTEKFIHIPQRAWRIPNEFEEWAKQYHSDAQTYLSKIFIDTLWDYENSNFALVRVAVSKGDLTAVFGVNVRRMQYFFQDRDIEISEGGVRRRVFHMVRGHERKTKHGTAYVRFHFKGAREFDWAGYRVTVTVPGRDHIMLPEISIGTVDEYWTTKDQEYLSSEQYGATIKEVINTPRVP